MKKQILAAGMGVAVAGGLVVAGPVLPASAADRPNSLGAARVAAPTKVNAWIDDERISSGSDQDWYRYELTRTAWVQIRLGALPADYQLALYGNNAKLIATTSRTGTQFEVLTKKLEAGTYFVKVWSAGSSSTKPYRLRFREMPQDSLFVLDQTVHFDQDQSGRHANFTATFFNSGSSWLRVPYYTVQYLDANGRQVGALRTIFTEWDGGEQRRIGPGGTLAVNDDNHDVKSTVKTLVLSAVSTPLGPPAETGLTIRRDPAHPVVRNKDNLHRTTYTLLVSNSSSLTRNFAAYARHYSSIGNLDYQGVESDTVGAGRTARVHVTLFNTDKIPNVLKFAVEKV